MSSPLRPEIGTRSYSLDEARQNVPIEHLLEADAVVVLQSTATDPVYLRVNHPDSPPIQIETGVQIRCSREGMKRGALGSSLFGPIKRLFLTNSPEPGKVLRLVWGVRDSLAFDVAAS